MVVDAKGFAFPAVGKPVVKRRVWQPLDANKKVPTRIGKPKKDTLTASVVSFSQIKAIEHEHIETVLGEIAAQVQNILEAARLAFPKATIPPL
jgi:hypothetical protein